MTGDHPIRRVLQIHTRYRHVGGEEHVVEAERQLLEAAGVSVEQVIFDNAELHESHSFGGDLTVAAGAIWSPAAERRVRAAVRGGRPQIVHVHNTFAAASPSVYRAALGIPIVQTLHNYRFVCPAATAFRDGHACTDCVGRMVPWPAVVHACVRDSHGQSAVAAATLAIHGALGTFARGIDVYVALTTFQRSVMVDGGLPAERVTVIPNFLEPDPGVGEASRRAAVYVGRLSVEKGIAPLLRAAALRPGSLRVAGTGPMASLVERSATAGAVTYLGPLEHDSVVRELKGAVALVVPSLCFEGFPRVILEAYATATPVIASRIGSLAELVEDGATGLLAQPDDAEELAGKVAWAIDHPVEMGRMGAQARRRYETRYRGATHLASLLDVYQELLAGGARRAVG